MTATRIVMHIFLLEKEKDIIKPVFMEDVQTSY